MSPRNESAELPRVQDDLRNGGHICRDILRFSELPEAYVRESVWLAPDCLRGCLQIDRPDPPTLLQTSWTVHS